MGYLTMLANYGKFVQVGAPEDAIVSFRPTNHHLRHIANMQQARD